jgi:hypothetical protein
MPKYFDAEGNRISFLAATKFQATHPHEYAEAQKKYGRGGLTVREFAREARHERVEEVQAKRLGLTPDELRSKAAEGSLSWWQTPDGLRSLGLTKFLVLREASYYGGWSGHQSPEVKSNLVLKVDVEGIALRKASTIFAIPWDEIADIAIEGPEEAQSRFTATRLVALGPLGLAFKKDRKGSKEAIITVTTQSGDEAIFHLAKTLPREISPKLEPLAIQARRANKSTEPVQPIQTEPDIAGQIEKLADLRDKGILSEEEFASKKAELLARM